MIQKLLQNPMALKVILATLFCLLLFMFFALMVHGMRKKIAADSEAARLSADNSPLFSLGTYQGVIQQLRAQDRELRQAREQDQQQAALAETISEAVLANLSSGVLFFDKQGLVRQANRAARLLLGYSSPFSFHIRDLFRGVTRVRWPDTDREDHSSAALIQAMQQSLRTGEPVIRARVDYLTPASQKRVLGITVSAVRHKSGEVFGLSCVVNDFTEVAELSHEVERAENLASLGEISAGLINDFKKSLNIIVEHAENLIKEDSSDASRFYAERILSEAESLARIVSDFLEFAGPKR